MVYQTNFNIFKLAVITPANVVTCPILNGPFCNDKVEFGEVTSITIVFEIDGSNIKLPFVT